MTLVGLAILALGLVDIVRAVARGLPTWARIAALLLALAALALLGWGLGATPSGIAFVVLIGAVWPIALRGRAAAASTPLTGAPAPLVVLGVVLVTSVIAGAGMPVPSQPDAWWAGIPVANRLALPDAVLVLGLALFQIESANLLVLATLRGEGVVSTEGGSSERTPGVATLRGGRLIGPLERLLGLGLALAGQYAFLAALLAAKGIVRFPEIQRGDRPSNQAEYFLIGTLVSWAVALASAGLFWVLHA